MFIESVSLVSSGLRKASENSFLEISNTDKMKGVLQKILKNPQVQEALKQGSGLGQISVSPKEGVSLQVGSVRVAIQDEKIISELLEIGKEIGNEVERKGLGTRISDLTEEQKECAEKVSLAFAKAKKALVKESAGSNKLISSDTETMLKSVGAGGAIMRNQFALNLDQQTVAGFSFLNRGKVLASLGVFDSCLNLLGVCAFPEILRSWKLATDHQNLEKQCLSFVAGVLGLGITASGAMELTEASAKLVSNLNVVKALAFPLSMFGGALIGIQSAYTAYHIGVIGKFRSELNAILNQPGIGEKQRYREALVWLRQQVTLTDAESEIIFAKARKENKDPEGEMKIALQKKWDRFELCTSLKNGALLAETISDEFLEKVEKDDPESKRVAQEILSEVSKANLTELGSYAFSAFLLILAIAAFVCSHVTGADALASPVLGIISGVLSFLVATQKYWVEALKKTDLYQGDHSFFGNKLWELRNKIFSNSNLIDRVESCTMNRFSTISQTISSPSEGSQTTQSMPIEETL